MVESDFRCQVLLAEDDLVSTELVMAILSVLECDVTAVAKGADAIEIFKTKRFHLVLLDFHLFDMNGDQVATAMRANEVARGARPTCIAALTGSAMPNEIARCRASGMDEILGKPIDFARLRALAVDAFQSECEIHD
ncbi:MAG: response regulator [Rubrivivax sp.]|nr:MAG: response regulator [Rubrivivax sp.]